MKRLSILLLSISLAANLFLPYSEASDICSAYKGVTKIWWDGVELKKGQIGRLTVLKDTPLFTYQGDKHVFSRMLKANEKYRIYAFYPGMLGLGGGYYVSRDSKVKYETPSKAKLQALACVYNNSKLPEVSSTRDPLVSTSNLPEIKLLTQEVNNLEVSIIKNGSIQQIELQSKSIQAKLDTLKYTQPVAIEPIVKRLKELNKDYYILAKKKLPSDFFISDMLVDEMNGYLYAISNFKNKLYVLSIKDLSIVKELSINKGSDMQLYEGKVFIAAKPFMVFDPNTLTARVNETPLYDVRSFVIHKDHLYYSTSDNYVEINDYDLNTKRVNVITKKDKADSYLFSSPYLTVDTIKSILYVSDNHTMKAIDLNTNDILLEYNKRDFKTYQGMLWDNGDLFISGYKIDPANFHNLLGSYVGDHFSIDTARGNYVFGHKFVFDRETFVPLRTLPIQMDIMVMDSFMNMYTYQMGNDTISKIKMNILPFNFPSFKQGNNQLIFENEIKDWEYDDVTNKIYAISQNDNKLFYINPDTMKVEKEVFIGSIPTDLELYDGSLYIALKGTHRIAVAGTNPEIPISYITLNITPDTIEIGKNHIFYQLTDQFNPIYAYDKRNGSITDIVWKMSETNIAIYSPKLKLDNNENILYIDDDRGEKIYAVNTETFQIMQSSNEDEFFGYGEMFLDRSTFYHGLYYSPKSDLKAIKVASDLPLVYVGNDYLIAQDGYYDKETLTKQTTFTNKIHSARMDNYNKVFILDEKQKVLTKYNNVTSIQR